MIFLLADKLKLLQRVGVGWVASADLIVRGSNPVQAATGSCVQQHLGGWVVFPLLIGITVAGAPVQFKIVWTSSTVQTEIINVIPYLPITIEVEKWGRCVTTTQTHAPVLSGFAAPTGGAQTIRATDSLKLATLDICVDLAAADRVVTAIADITFASLAVRGTHILVQSLTLIGARTLALKITRGTIWSLLLVGDRLRLGYYTK